MNCCVKYSAFTRSTKSTNSALELDTKRSALSERGTVRQGQVAGGLTRSGHYNNHYWMIPALLMLLLADAQPVPAMFTRAPPCRSATAPIDEACEIPLAVSGAEALHLMGSRDHVWWLDGDRLTMIARPTVESWVMLCCSVQTPLDPIKGTDLAAITVRVPRLREAILDVRPSPTRDDVPEIVRGPEAPPAPERLMPPASRLIRCWRRLPPA